MGTMVVEGHRQRDKWPPGYWAYPGKSADELEYGHAEQVGPLREPHRPKASNLFPYHKTSTSVAGTPRVEDLGKINLGLFSLQPVREVGIILVPIGLVTGGLTGLGSYAAFDALDRTPSTWLKIGLVVAGIGMGGAAIQSLILAAAGVVLAVAPEKMREGI